MTLNFPNESRSYDARKNRIRFWGYDSALEISFFIEIGVLHKLAPPKGNAEDGYLEAFDAARERIYEVARKVYSRNGRGAYLLAAADF